LGFPYRAVRHLSKSSGDRSEPILADAAAITHLPEGREGDFRCGCEGFVSDRNKRPFISPMIIASMLHYASRSAKRRKADARHAAKGTAGGELNVSWRAALNVGKVHTAIFHIVRPSLILICAGNQSEIIVNNHV
jgi:hypothetical protein